MVNTFKVEMEAHRRTSGAADGNECGRSDANEGNASPQAFQWTDGKDAGTIRNCS
jgi:hypothetical protein